MNYPEKFAIEQADPEHMRNVLIDILDVIGDTGNYLDRERFWELFAENA